MSAEQVDEYLRAVEEPKRSTLQTMRRTILEIVPDAEQVISYGVPAFRVDGQIVAGPKGRIGSAANRVSGRWGWGHYLRRVLRNLERETVPAPVGGAELRESVVVGRSSGGGS
jgi:hypothetical protein